MKFELKPNNRNPNPRDVLDDLKKTAQKMGKSTLTTLEYKDNGRWHPDTPIRLFKTWNIALSEAGLEIRKRVNISDEELFENLQAIWVHLGRQPYISDIKKPYSKVDASVYKRRFKSWRNALEAFVKNANRDSDENSNPLIATSKVINPPTNRTPKAPGWRIRFLIMKRDQFKCRLCGASPSSDSKVVLVIDHIHPRSKDGLTTFENLQTLCEVCNGGKSNLV